MRWVKIIALFVSGAVVGGSLCGYVVFEYISKFGIAWNQWASSHYAERKADDALGTVAALNKLHTGSIDGARSVLEWRLNEEIPELVGLRRAGRDSGGHATKAIAAIREYRQANPWSSGNLELDRLMSDTLGDVTNDQEQTH